MLEHLELFLRSVIEVNYWNYSRAAGIMAYLFVWLAAISGLLSKAKILPRTGSVSTLMDVHRKMACFGFYFIIFHALILSYDDYIKLKVDDLLIPFRSSYQSSNMSMGILAFYGTILVIGSMFFLGGRAFRYWHLLTYPVYFLALWHGLNMGTDSHSTWMQAIYWSTGCLIVVASIYRVIQSIKGFHRSIET